MAIGPRELLLVCSDGQTSRITVPSPSVWLDNDNAVQAWVNAEVRFPHSEYRLRDGTIIRGLYTTFNMVPSGRFFIVVTYTHDQRGTVISCIYSNAEPRKPILRIEEDAALFEKADMLYVFRWAKPGARGHLRVDIYQTQNAVLEHKQMLEIKSPSWLFPNLCPIDVSPFDDEVVLLNGRDEFGSKYYIFNFATGKTRYLGPVRSKALFLSEPLVERISPTRSARPPH